MIPTNKLFTFHPLSPERWDDLVQLFGERGACGGCWCMWLRVPRSQFTRQKGGGNKSALKALVRKREDIGILAYIGDQPVGWCAVAPRESYPALERSRILKRIDDEPVWSVTCLFVAKPFRRRGITVQLLKAAIQHVQERGGKILESYPVEPKRDQVPDAFAWHGLASAFRQAGFRECARRSETRPIMRYSKRVNERTPTIVL